MAGVRDRWTADGKRFMRELEELARLKVCIGYQSDDPDNNRNPKEKSKKCRRKRKTKSDEERIVTNIDVALWNELGTSRSPSRPFMRNSIDNHTDVIRAFAAGQIKQLAAGASARDVLNSMGDMQAGLMQYEIEEGKYKANAPSTLRQKESDRPLIDSSQLQQSIHFVIKPKGKD